MKNLKSSTWQWQMAHGAPQMAAVFELASSIYSTVPQFCSPCSTSYLEPVGRRGGGQRKTQKPEVCLEFIPLNISHSWTKNISISQQQGNHVLHNSETTHPKQKQVKNNCINQSLQRDYTVETWSLSEHWIISIVFHWIYFMHSPSFSLREAISKNSITQIPLFKKPDILILQLKKNLALSHQLNTIFL